jgi:hypothetical protein
MAVTFGTNKIAGSGKGTTEDAHDAWRGGSGFCPTYPTSGKTTDERAAPQTRYRYECEILRAMAEAEANGARRTSLLKVAQAYAHLARAMDAIVSHDSCEAERQKSLASPGPSTHETLPKF